MGKDEQQRQKPAAQLRQETQRQVRSGRWQQAAENYRSLAELEPREPQHRLREADCLRRAGDDAGAAHAYLQAAQGFLQLGTLSKASAVCRTVLQLFPDADHVRELLASVEVRKRQQGARLEDLPPGAQLTPPPSAPPPRPVQLASAPIVTAPIVPAPIVPAPPSPPPATGIEIPEELFHELYSSGSRPPLRAQPAPPPPPAEDALYELDLPEMNEPLELEGNYAPGEG